MFLPDESTLAGQLCALASAAELGLIVAEYQRKRRSNGDAEPLGEDGMMFDQAPRFVDDDGDGNGSLSALEFHSLFATESLTNRPLLTVCLHCFRVRNDTLAYQTSDFCSRQCRRAAADALERAREQQERHYVRFGLWDAATETSINFQTGAPEPGVSCYDAFYDPEDGCYRLDTSRVRKYATRVKHCLPWFYDRHVFILAGDKTKHGVDGEPCLRNVRLIAPAIWRNCQIVPIPLERLLVLAEALDFGSERRRSRRSRR